MRIAISVAGAREEEGLQSLRNWLTMDRSIMSSSLLRLESTKESDPSEQSAAIDIISLVTASGFSAVSLGISIANWRATRIPPPTVTVQRPDGMTVTISGGDPQREQRILQQLLEGEP